MIAIINPNQHGFRPCLFCRRNWYFFVDEILKPMDSNHQVDLLLLNFPKPLTQLLITDFT